MNLESFSTLVGPAFLLCAGPDATLQCLKRQDALGPDTLYIIEKTIQQIFHQVSNTHSAASQHRRCKPVLFVSFHFCTRVIVCVLQSRALLTSRVFHGRCRLASSQATPSAPHTSHARFYHSCGRLTTYLDVVPRFGWRRLVIGVARLCPSIFYYYSSSPPRLRQITCSFAGTSTRGNGAAPQECSP